MEQRMIKKYYPYGMLIDSGAQEVQPFKYSGKELDRVRGLNAYDYGARMLDAALPVWDRVDPLAEKYYNVSPYAYCAGNPVKFVDPDGRKVVDPSGRRMLYYDNQSQLHFTKYANEDVHRIVGSLCLTNTGAQMLKQVVNSSINVQFFISNDIKENGNKITYGETIQGNFKKADNYGKTPDGKGIKEASITIYEGSIEKGVASGSGLKHEGLTPQQALGAVIAHEIVHATDKKEIAKDLKYESQGKLNPEREVKPNEIESRLMEEYKK